MSDRAAALKELAYKWVRPSASGPAAEESEEDLAAVLTRRVTAVELKAGLTDLRAQRMQRSCKQAVSKKSEQATQLLRENNSLRKENKRLRDQLSLGSVERMPATVLVGQQKQPGTAVHPPAWHGIDPGRQRDSLETVDEDWAGQFSGSSGIGSRAAPSRPTSATLTGRAPIQSRSSSRPSSARPHSAKLVASRGVPGGETQSPLKRPSSAHALGRNGRPLAAAARSAMLPLTAAVRGSGRGTPHAVAQLREQSECQASLIEDQQAELQLLKAMLHERAMQVHDGNDEEDKAEFSELEYGGTGAKETVGGRQQDTQHAGQFANSDSASHWDGKMVGTKRRPTSAGGVGVERARQVLQFHGRSNGR